MEQYHYRKEESIHFLRGFQGALHGFVSLEEAGFFQDAEINTDESFVWLVSHLIAGLDTKDNI